MAQIHSDFVAISISRLVRDNESVDSCIDAELLKTLEEVVQQLVGEGKIVEVKEG